MWRPTLTDTGDFTPADPVRLAVATGARLGRRPTQRPAPPHLARRAAVTSLPRPTRTTAPPAPPPSCPSPPSAGSSLTPPPTTSYYTAGSGKPARHQRPLTPTSGPAAARRCRPCRATPGGRRSAVGQGGGACGQARSSGSVAGGDNVVEPVVYPGEGESLGAGVTVRARALGGAEPHEFPTAPMWLRSPFDCSSARSALGRAVGGAGLRREQDLPRSTSNR